MSLGGVALVALGASGGLTGSASGVALGAVGPLTWTLFSIILAPYARATSPTRAIAVAMTACVIPLLLVAAPQLPDEDWGSISALAWVGLVFSALGVQVGSSLIWFHVVKSSGTARASIYANLQPFLGVLWAVVLLGERLTAVQLGGGALIAVAIVVARWRRPLASIPP
jgi:drug/metabolite transporter (DMT)-like permease